MALVVSLKGAAAGAVLAWPAWPCDMGTSGEMLRYVFPRARTELAAVQTRCLRSGSFTNHFMLARRGPPLLVESRTLVGPVVSGRPGVDSEQVA